MRLLLLIPVALLGLATAGAFASTHKAQDAAAVGKITSLTSTSITVRKHNPLTCAIGTGSPDTSMFAVRERVRIGCVDHVLVEIAGRGTTKASVTGAILRRNGNSVTIDGKHDVTCKLDGGSPGLTGHKVGEVVTVECEHGVLVTLSTTDTPAGTAGLGGTITALGATSITVHDDGRDLTCTIGPSSPSVAGLEVGDHVKIGCVNGVLTTVRPEDDSPSTTTSDGTKAALSGPISALTAGSIAVHDGDRTLTCTIGPASPSTSGYAVGAFVRMYCRNGALYYIAHNGDDDGQTTTTTTTTTATTTTAGTYTNNTGTITSLGATITVHNSEHDLTCTIGAGSPSTSGFAVGNTVRMYCLNGALYYLAHVDPPTTTTTATTTTAATTTAATPTISQITGINGSISALGAGSISVHNSEGSGNDLTCSIPGGMATGGFAVGNSVAMYCLNGVLYALQHE